MPFPTTPVVPRRTGGLEMFADVLEKNKTLPPRPVQHHPKEICLSPTRELPALPAATVVIRSRPQNKRERKKSETIIVHTDEETHKVTVVQQRRDKLTKKIFTFDHVSGETSTQQDVYQKCVQPVVAEVLEGFNCTVFA